MIVKRDEDYCSYLLLQPYRNDQGELISLDIRTRFIIPATGVQIPEQFVLPGITAQEHIFLFHEKLALLETWQHFFISRSLFALVDINEVVAQHILNDENTAAKIAQFSFLELTINESFSEVNKGNENKTLLALSQRFPLVLANFGAGIATARPVIDGLFSRVILDRSFVQRLITQPSFEPFMRTLITQLKPGCGSFIISGIDNQLAYQRASGLGFTAMQGACWSAVEPENLASLI